MYKSARLVRLQSLALVVCVTLALFIALVPPHVAAITLLGDRYDKLSTSAANTPSNHLIGIHMLNTAVPVGSISLEFCSNSPIFGDVCNTPAGFDASAAVLAAQTGETGFSIHGNSTPTHLILTRTPSVPSGAMSTYLFTDVVNPSAIGSYFLRIQTFSSTDATGPDIENGGVVLSVTSGVSVSAEVPPYIRFCAAVAITSLDCSTASSYFIDLGELRPTATSHATSQFVIATNAAYGYSIFLNGTTLTSGNNIIPAMTSLGSSSVGTSQFGINLRANTNPTVGSEVVGPGTSTATADYGTVNQFKFLNGDTLVTVANSNADRKFTVSYIVNVSTAQPAGVYSTTVTYICLANF